MPARISCIKGAHTFSCRDDTQHEIRIIVHVYIFNEFLVTQTLSRSVWCAPLLASVSKPVTYTWTVFTNHVGMKSN